MLLMIPHFQNCTKLCLNIYIENEDGYLAEQLH